jgi:transposase-like protein
VGHRRSFSNADKRQMLDEAAQPDASVAEVARRYRIARRALCRWKRIWSLPVLRRSKV